MKFNIEKLIEKISPRAWGIIIMIIIALITWKYLLFMICSLLVYYGIM